jgi:hypothetical protein
VIAQGYTPRMVNSIDRGVGILRKYNALTLPVAYTWQCRQRDGMVEACMTDGTWAVIVAGKVAARADDNATVVAAYSGLAARANACTKRNGDALRAAAREAAVAAAVDAGVITASMVNRGSKAPVTPARHVRNVNAVLGVEA